MTLLPWSAFADGPTFAAYDLTRVAGDAASSDEFGQAVAMENNTLVIGAHFDDSPGNNAGSAYVFSRNEGGSNNWGQVKKLLPSDPENDDEFGFSVDVDGDLIIVGAPYDNDQGSDSGSAYIFSRNQGGANQWGQIAKLTNSTGAAGDEFGFDVAIDDDTAVVGAPLDDDKGGASGAAHIFLRTLGGANAWGQVTTITASDGAANDRFGYGVDIDGTDIVVGARDENSTGAIYLFSLSGTWNQIKKRQATGAVGDDDFGQAVAIEGDRVLVGAPGDFSDKGSAFIFERNQSGANQWGQVQKMTASDASGGDRFGHAVAIYDDVAMVGAYQDHSPLTDAGSAYLFGSS